MTGWRTERRRGVMHVEDPLRGAIADDERTSEPTRSEPTRSEYPTDPTSCNYRTRPHRPRRRSLRIWLGILYRLALRLLTVSLFLLYLYLVFQILSPPVVSGSRMIQHRSSILDMKTSLRNTTMPTFWERK